MTPFSRPRAFSTGHRLPGFLSAYALARGAAANLGLEYGHRTYMRPIWERWGTAFEKRVVILAVLPLAVIAAAGAVQEAPAAKPSKVMFEKTCSACHTAESVSSARRTREQWQEVMDEMVSQQGAKIGDEEYTPILEYLVAAFGKVNVNSAPADEIAQITGLSQKEAEAIVKFRKDNGKFEDFDGLGKVPGVDLKKLESKRDAIAY